MSSVGQSLPCGRGAFTLPSHGDSQATSAAGGWKGNDLLPGQDQVQFCVALVWLLFRSSVGGGLVPEATACRGAKGRTIVAVRSIAMAWLSRRLAVPHGWQGNLPVWMSWSRMKAESPSVVKASRQYTASSPNLPWNAGICRENSQP